MISYLLITEGYFIFIGPVKYMNEGVPSFFFFFFFFFFVSVGAIFSTISSSKRPLQHFFYSQYSHPISHNYLKISFYRQIK